MIIMNYIVWDVGAHITFNGCVCDRNSCCRNNPTRIGAAFDTKVTSFCDVIVRVLVSLLIVRVTVCSGVVEARRLEFKMVVFMNIR